MDNEVVIHVRVENETAAGFSKARAGANKTASDIEGDFAKAFAKASRSVSTEISRTTASAEGEFAKVSKSISHSGSAIATELKDEFGKAGKSIVGESGKAAGGVEHEFAKVGEKIAKTGARIGAETATEMGSSMSEGLSGLAPVLVPVLAGFGIAAAPILGGAIAGAIIGGAGIGGVIGGVTLAARDPAVQFAGKQLGESLLKDLTQRASVFIDPIMRGIDMVKSSFGAMGADFSRIFNNSAKFLEPLIGGIATMIQKITHGIANLTDVAGPVIDVISNGFADIGGAIMDMFNGLKDNGVDAAVALDVVFKGLEVTIRILGGAINILVESFGFLAKIGAFGQQAQIEYIRLTENAKLAAAANQGAAASFGKLGGAAGEAAGPIATLGDKLNSIYNIEHKLFDATTNAEEAFYRLSESIKKNGKSLDVHTEKGRANRTALSHLVTELNNQYKAYEEANGAGAAASRVANSNYNSFIHAAQGLGISKSAARDYAHQLGLIPPQKTTNFYANTHDAAGRLAALQGQINNIHGKTVEVRVITSKGGQKLLASGGGRQAEQLAHGGIKGAASGMIGSGTTMVGEYGPELVDLPPGTRVHSNPDTMRMLAGGGGGGGATTLILQSGGSRLDDFLVEILRTAVRVKGAGSVQRLLGRPGVAA